jgi:hypothetical protein
VIGSKEWEKEMGVRAVWFGLKKQRVTYQIAEANAFLGLRLFETCEKYQHSSHYK